MLSAYFSSLSPNENALSQKDALIARFASPTALPIALRLINTMLIPIRRGRVGGWPRRLPFLNKGEILRILLCYSIVKRIAGRQQLYQCILHSSMYTLERGSFVYCKHTGRTPPPPPNIYNIYSGVYIYTYSVLRSILNI